MGIASSSGAAAGSPSACSEGEHFSLLVNPAKALLSSSDAERDAAGKDADKAKRVALHNKARILKRLQFTDVWNQFLQSAATSFALTPSELQSLLQDVTSQPSSAVAKADQPIVDTEIKDFVGLIVQLSENDTSKTVDFMAVCSALLFLNPYPIEMKVDQLFTWIVLNPEVSDFHFEDFLIAVSSFERGLSHAMGRVASSEAYIKDVATQWFALCDPLHRGVADAQTKISQSQFFDFCMNRQHVVRRLLEVFPALAVFEDKNTELVEVSDTIDLLRKPVGSGDEWMANPAWIKTAQRLTPPAALAAYKNTKPTSYLELEWVHGYRGFDCRNNLYYVDEEAQWFAYPAAALTVMQDTARSKQSFFGEHKDDVTAFTSLAVPSRGCRLYASGEIGKQPSIYLCSSPLAAPGSRSSSSSTPAFSTLACLRGFHTKGIAHLAFSSDGRFLFSIGVEYSLAVYATDPQSADFGKLVASAQGPKDRVLHCAYGCPSADGQDHLFVSCGEKHALVWTFTPRRGSLKQEQVKSTAAGSRSQIYLSVVSLLGGQWALLSTQLGEMYALHLATKALQVARLRPLSSSSGKEAADAASRAWAHDKAAINALCVHHDGEMVVSGDRDGKILVWLAAPSAEAFTLQALTSFSVNCPASGGGAEGGGGEDGAGEGKSRSSLPAIRALSLSANGRKLLVGTQTCEILEYPLSLSSSSTSSPATTAVASPTGVSLVSGHYLDEVWGLAVRPITEANHLEGVHYATAGDDRTVRIWDITSHRLLATIPLPAPSRACTYSPDGRYLAVGLGGGGGRKAKEKGKKVVKDTWEGSVKIYRLDSSPSSSSPSPSSLSVSLVADIRDAKQAVSCLRYSPDGTLLAVGTRDNGIYVYSVPNQYKRKHKFSKHNAGILQLDFSRDGRILQSCCSAYEILFSDAHTGAQVTESSGGGGNGSGGVNLRQVEWSSWTCTLGWSVQGIWCKGMDGSDVNAVDRSPSQRYLVSGDDWGRVNLYTYPALAAQGSAHSSFTGHSSHVTCVKWTSLPSGGDGTTSAASRKTSSSVFQSPYRDDYVLSTGGMDKCILQWKHSDPTGREAAGQPLASASSSSRLSLSHGGEEGREGKPAHEAEGEDLLDWGAPSAGDEFMAVKPWLGAIVSPSPFATPDPQKIPPYLAALNDYLTQLQALSDSPPSSSVSEGGRDAAASLASLAEEVCRRMQESGYVNPSPPGDDLDLDWVHGYRGFDCRNNIFYLSRSRPASSSSGEDRRLVYFAAALGIVYDPVLRKQYYFHGHNDDILAMAVYDTRDNPLRGGANSANAEGDSPYIVATGQVGPGSVHLWDPYTLRTLAVVKTKQKTVQQLAFSLDGRLLFVASEDLQLVVYDWKSQSVLATAQAEGRLWACCTARGPSSSLKDSSAAAVTPSAFQIFTSGDKTLRLWTVTGRQLTSAKYVTSSCAGTALQSFWTVASLPGDVMAVGCEDGSLYLIPRTGKGVLARLPPPPPGSEGGAGGREASGKGKGKAKATAAAVTACTTYTSSSTGASYLVTGSRDGRLAAYETTTLSAANLTPRLLFVLSLATLAPQDMVAGQIHALSVHAGPVSASSQAGAGGESWRLAVGTRGCDLLELDLAFSSSSSSPVRPTASLHQVLVRGHFQDEVWAIAAHPSRPEYCSAGDDKTLRVYSLRDHRVLAVHPLGHLSRALAYSPRGDLLAAGFGGRVGRGKETGGGLVRLYSTASSTSLSLLCEKHDAKQWISDIKFTPDGQTIVASAHDCKVYIYDLSPPSSETGSSNKNKQKCELRLRCAFSKHNAVVLHVDISRDSRYLQSTCAAYELLFCDLQTGRQVTSPAEVKDVAWQDWTCPLGWPVQGIWGASGPVDGSEINAVRRSHTGHLLASADDSGNIHLYRYPVSDKAAKRLTFKGHSSHVMGLAWTCADEFLLSAGGHDKCIFQWRHRVEEHLSPTGGPGSGMELAGGGGAGGSKKTVRIREGDRPLSASSSHSSSWRDGEDGSETEDESGSFSASASFSDSMLLHGPAGAGDESGAVKPWLGAVRPPSHPPPISSSPPAVEFSLQWVHGYSSSLSQYSRPNCFYSAEGDVVYPAAALGISLHRPSSSSSSSSVDWKQAYLTGHDDDILCLTLSPHRRFIATGQIASKALKGRASIFLWNADDTRLLNKLVSCHLRGVQALAFSPSSRRLVSVGLDDSYTHIVWADRGGQWSQIQQVGTSPGDKQPVLVLHWLPPGSEGGGASASSDEDGDVSFVSGGQRLLSVWKMEGGKLVKKTARHSTKQTGKEKDAQSSVSYLAVTSLSRPVGRVSLLLGTSRGDLVGLQPPNELTVQIEGAHTAAVLSLCETEDWIVSGGQDGVVKLWNRSLQLLGSLDVLSRWPSPASLPTTSAVASRAIASLDVQTSGHLASKGDTASGPSCLHVLLGTLGGDILEMSLPTGPSPAAPSSTSSSNTTSSSSPAPPSSSDRQPLDLSKASLSLLASSHGQGEVWGLAPHPLDADLVATVGDDASLRVWSVRRHVCIGRVNLPRPARCVAWHPLGSMLVVGLQQSSRKAGSGKKASKKKKATAAGGGQDARKGNKLGEIAEDKDEEAGENDGREVSASSSYSSLSVQESMGLALYSFRITGSSACQAEITLRAAGVSQSPSNAASTPFPSVSEVKFSPAGDVLLVASRDGKIRGYPWPSVLVGDVSSSAFPWEDYRAALSSSPSFVFDKHSSAVTHMDVSMDGAYLQSNDMGNELLFFDLAKKKQEPSASKVADYNSAVDDNEEREGRLWASQTCPFGWSVQGIWPPNAYDSSEINAVDRHPGMRLLATAEDSGKIRVLRFPCAIPNSQAVELRGHASHVTNVRWGLATHLFSTGGNDRCVFVWEMHEK